MNICLNDNYNKNYHSGEINSSLFGEFSDLSSLISNLKSSLGDKTSFSVSQDSSKQPEQYEESIDNLIGDIMKELSSMKLPNGMSLNRTQKGVIRAELRNYLLPQNNIVQKEEKKAVIPQEEMITEEQRREKEFDETLDYFFSNNLAVRQDRSERIARELLMQSVIDTKNKKIVSNNEELNENFKELKRQEYLKLRKFLEKQGYDTSSYPQYLYKEGKVLNNYHNALNDFYNFVQEKIRNNSWESELFQSWVDSMTNTNDLIEALNAYLTLQYFDDTISKSLGSYIKIDDSLAEPVTEINEDGIITVKYKYSFNSGNAETVHGWETNSNRDAIKEMGKFSKLLIESIPLINYNTNGTALKLNLNAVRFTNAVAHLFDAINKISENYDLKELASEMHYSPELYFPKILNILFKRDNITLLNGLRKHGLSDFDINVLYSIKEQVYHGKHSYNAIEQDYIAENGLQSTRYPIVSSLLGVIDSTVIMNYLQTKYNFNTDQYETSIKIKFPADKIVYNMVEDVNNKIVRSETKEELLSKYPLKAIGERDYEITIGGKKYLFKSAVSGQGILTKLFSNDSRHTWVDNLTDFFGKGENAKKIDIVHDKERLINKVNLTPYEQEFMDLLEFIDSMLKTTFSKDVEGLQEFMIFNHLDKKGIENLLLASARALVITDIHNKFDNSGLTSLEFKKFLEQNSNIYQHTDLSKLGTKKKNLIGKKSFGEYLTVLSPGEEWIRNLSHAKAILSGEVSKAVIKNMENDSIPNFSPAYEGAAIHRRLRQINKHLGATSHLLFANGNQDAILDVVVDTDVSTYDGKKKQIKSMTQGELLYHSIVDKFFLPQLEGSKSVVIQATTYSDKTKFVNYRLKQQLTGTLNLATADAGTLEKAIFDTIGRTYVEVYQKVIENYSKIFGTSDVREISNKLREISIEAARYKKDPEQELYKLANIAGVTLYRDIYFRKTSVKTQEFDKPIKMLQINELLYDYATNLYSSRESLHRRLEKEKIKFVESLIKNRVQFKLSLNGTDLDDNKNDLTTILVKRLGDHKARQWHLYDKMIIAKIKDSEGKVLKNIVYGNSINLKPGETLELNPILENYFLAHNLCANNLRFSLSASELNHKVKSLGKQDLSKGVLAKFTNFLADYGITELSSASIVDIKEALKYAENDNDILMLPIEEETFIGDDVLITSPEEIELNKQTIENHFNTIVAIEDIINKKLYEIEALAQGAQLKRNVIIPATLRYYQQGTLQGIGATMKVAIFDDIRANVYNFDGKSDGIDAHDGAAYVDPFSSRLENLSLQDNEVGTVKKPIWHGYDYEHMTAFLAKYAVDTITNQWMRQSELSNLSLRNLFKKMTNIQWEEEIDLIDGCGFKKDPHIDFYENILEKSRLFYGKGDNNYEITGFGKDENGYYTIEQLVSPTGESFPDSPETKVYHYFDVEGNHYNSPAEGRHSINSLFELHTALGGIYSKSLTENGLQYSEASVYAVANFMNHVAVLRPGIDPKNATLDQYSYRQPLKEYVISYAANNSAIKNGAGNVNPTSSFYDNTKLMYITVSTEGHGIQMDADHESDEAQMTEFSQVISSLDAGGRMHDYVKTVYKVLGQVALEQSQLELDAIKSFKESGDINIIYDVIGRTIINNLANKSGQAGLAESILKQIKKKFNLNSDHSLDEFKIPFSDPNIYSNILSTFVSIINRKSIKRKYPGLGTVLVPGYDMSMIYEIDGKIYQFEDLIKLANRELEDSELSTSEDISTYNKENVQRWLDKKHNDITINPIYNDLSEFGPSDNIEILKNGDVIVDSNNNIFSPNLDDIEEYYKFTKNPAQYLLEKGITIAANESLQFRRRINKPRNLAPARISFKYVDIDNTVKHTNIFNTWALDDAYNAKDKSKRAKQYDVQRVLDGLARNKFVKRILTADNKYEYIELDIVEGSLVNKPAELIMSNIYKSKYGIKDGQSMIDVRETPGQFNKNIEILNSDFFEMAFTKGNGDHLYITFNKIKGKTDDFDASKKNWQFINRVPFKDNSRIADRVYATDIDNTRLFEIGRDIIQEDVEYDVTLKKFKLKGETTILPNQRDYRIKNGKVVKYVEFVHRYEVNDNGVRRTLYNIDKPALMEVYHVKASEGQDLEKVKEEQVNIYISKLLAKLYKASDYNGVRVNKTTNRRTAKLFEATLKGFGNELAYDQNLKELIYNIQSLYQGATTDDLTDYNISTKKYKKYIRDYYYSLEDKIKSSYEKAQEFTASRIPAQTLQSFMQMLCVGYTGTSTNQCFVSHWQTWLQGSDYDIDKAYIMGHSFDDNGVYIGWSNMFKYSSVEALKASEQLPMPDGTVYTLSDKGVDISAYEAQYTIADNVNKVKILTSVLKYLDTNNITKINTTKESELYQALHMHQSTKLPKNLKLEAFKNFVSSHIETIIQDPRNMIGAYSPIEMSMFSNASDQLSKKSAASKQMTLYNPAVIYEMQYQNMTGKNVIGIAATGEKASFMWHHWMQEIIKNPEEFAKWGFKHSSSRINGRTKVIVENGNKKIVESDPVITTINCLPDIFFNDTIPDNIYKLTGDITVDLLISQVLSAATDNAKELILAKVNAGNKLAKCYLYLITLGYNINDIVSFMTSDALTFIDTFTETNIYNDVNINEKEAIALAKGELPKSIIYQFLPGKLEKIFKGSNKGYEEALTNGMELKLPNDAPVEIRTACQNFINFIEEVRIHRPIEVNMEDIAEFENVLKGANEFSNFGRLLGMNQGLPTSKIDLNNLLQKIKDIVTSREKDLGLVNDKGEIEEIPDFLQEFSDIVGKFDSKKYLTDSNYRNRAIEYQNAIKQNIPIFKIIEDIPQFKAIMDLLEGIHIMDSVISIKTKLFDHIYSKLKDEEGYYIDEFIQKGILSFIDGLITVNYLKKEKIKYPIKKGTKTFNDYRQIIDVEEELDLSTPTGISSFKYVFENVVIPKLQEGIYFDGNEDIVDDRLKNNEFIKGLITTTNKGVPLYKVNLDMLARESSVGNRVKFQNYIKGLKSLQEFTIGNKSLSDWFMICNLVVNKNNYGSDRLTTLLQGFIQDYNINTSFINDYLKYVGTIDQTGKIEDFDFTIQDVLMATAKTVNSLEGQNVPMVILNTDRGPVYYIKNKDKYGYKEYRKPIEEISGEPTEQYLERLNNHLEYDTLNLNYSSYINAIILDLAKLDQKSADIIDNLIRQGAIKLNDVC